jgi:nitrogen fixation protein FixH
MSAQSESAGKFTGKHMLAIMLAFFGVVIAVNLVMATAANRSWTGLVVKNSYVASQEFNRKAEEGRAQAALGWKGQLEIGGGRVSYRLVDKDGMAVTVEGVVASFRRPAYESEDRTITLAREAEGTFGAAEAVRDGIWIVEIDAEAGLPKPYRDVRRIVVENGLLK